MFNKMIRIAINEDKKFCHKPARSPLDYYYFLYFEGESL